MNENDNAAEVIEPTSETTETNATATEATKFYAEKPPKNQIIGKFYEAILDPKGLSLEEWLGIQESIQEIERLSPHIELIVRLRKEKNN